MKVYEKKWENIKIGEAFYFYGCEGFGVRISMLEYIIIDSDNHVAFAPGRIRYYPGPFFSCKAYGLPVAMRRAMEVS